MDRLLAALEHIQWRNIAVRRMQSLSVVTLHEAADRPLRVFDRKRRRRTDRLTPDRPVTAFDPAIALRIEGTVADVRYPGDLHQSREAINDCGLEHASAGDVNVSHIDMPVLMRLEWLNETFALA